MSNQDMDESTNIMDNQPDDDKDKENQDEEDESKVDDEPKNDKENLKKSMSDVEGKILYARLNGIIVEYKDDTQETFNKGWETRLALLQAGHSYINGKWLMMDVCQTDQELDLFFPSGMEVRFDAFRLKEPHRALDMPKNLKWNGTQVCNFEISTLWLKNKVDRSLLKAKPTFPTQDEGAQSRYQWINQNVLIGEAEAPKRMDENEDWFIVSISESFPEVHLPHPKEAPFKGVSGVVTELYRPEGGIVNTLDGRRVFFHRGRVFLKGGRHLQCSDELDEVIQEGTECHLDYDENKYFPGYDVPFVALCVYLDDNRPEISEAPFDTGYQNKKEKANDIVAARIISFDPPNEDKVVESGVAVVIKNAEEARIAELDLTDRKRVKFHRKNMLLAGRNLRNGDLRNFFSNNVFGNDVFYCFIEKIEGEDEKEHRAIVCWKEAFSLVHSTGGGDQNLGAALPYTVMFNSLQGVYTMSLTLFLKRELLDIRAFEELLDGNVSAEAATEGNDHVRARVIEVIPPKLSKTKNDKQYVHFGKVCVETGEHAGQWALFDYNVCSIFGFRLNMTPRTNLQQVLEMNDPVFVKVTPCEKEANHGCSIRVTDLWLGTPWPGKELPGEMSEETKAKMARYIEKNGCSPDEPKMESVSTEVRSRFLMYLDHHGFESFYEFLQTVRGQRPAPHFIPFLSTCYAGSVVHLERSPTGSHEGVIRVRNGSLENKYVEFKAENIFLFDYNAAKADLAYVLLNNTFVNLEVVPVANRKRFGFWLKHAASIIWTGPRPRNKGYVADVVHMERRSRKVEKFQKFLRPRGLSEDEFVEVMSGRTPPLDHAFVESRPHGMLANHDYKNFVKRQKKGVPPVGMMPQQPAVVPHGDSEALQICSRALSIQGPQDPNLVNLIANDNQAQMAFNIQKALEAAINSYHQLRNVRNYLGQGGPLGGPFSQGNFGGGWNNRGSNRFGGRGAGQGGRPAQGGGPQKRMRR